jgi:hypothetical protein
MQSSSDQQQLVPQNQRQQFDMCLHAFRVWLLRNKASMPEAAAAACYRRNVGSIWT